ncbi:hypothetical protein [Bradyrhizobium guangdongense]|uniref:Uncharacterized protein n=1 Tax=Bradyrhizobium guangdongense TaxID=1325090 RepID=A0AA88B7R9_9BRAD|nr:hypothetical protein [Bradyrhizobium guangdongense]GGI23723.1 hypothetical protein GCM10010987_25810 [Bradyrhizobium guangdongense]
MKKLSHDELAAVCGGMKNIDNPGVAAAMSAFYGVLFCGGTSQLPPSTIAHPDGSVGKSGGGSYSNCSPA